MEANRARYAHTGVSGGNEMVAGVGRAGNEQALEKLFPLVHQELRYIARHYMSKGLSVLQHGTLNCRHPIRD